VNARRGLQLARPRDLGALFGDSLEVYFRHFGTFLALSAMVVVPVELIVAGVGLEQLTAGYDRSLSSAELVVIALVTFLVVTPLINAICIHSLHSIATGGSPGARRAVVEGFEAFTPIFFAVVLAALGIVLGLVLVVPGVYLYFRWYFVPQTVVIEGVRGPAALNRSGVVTRGQWLRTAGIVVLAIVASAIPALVVAAPADALAESSDRAVWSLVGTIVADTFRAPFLALVSTLLYYDLRARTAGAAA
jgi:hypothetical protein